MESSASSTTISNGKQSFVWQYVSTFIATLLLLSSGLSLGWSSPSIPKLLNDEQSPIHVTPDQSSWVVSMMDLGMGIATIPSVWLMDAIGRKRTLTIGAIPALIAWILIGTGDTVIYLYVARFLGGVSLGLGYCVLPMYLGEIASPQIRGTLAIVVTLMNKTGVLFAYSVGPFVAFRTLAYLSIVPSACFAVASFWLPESVYYLLAKGDTVMAERNLVKLRGHGLVDAELQRMAESVQRSKENVGTFRDLFYTARNRRSLFIILTLGSVQILCGSQAVIAYSQLIFDQIDTGIAAEHVSILMAVVQLVSVVVCTFTVDRVGRRPLILLSIAGTTASNVVVTVYFYCERIRADLTGVAWLPVLAIMVFIVSYNIGLPTVNLAILGEIFPSNLKAVAGLVYTMLLAFLAFGTNKLFQVISSAWGTDVAFGMFTGFGLLFLPLAWLLVPETKGKSLETILEDLEVRSK